MLSALLTESVNINASASKMELILVMKLTKVMEKVTVSLCVPQASLSSFTFLFPLPFSITNSLLENVIATIDVHDAILEVELPFIPIARYFVILAYHNIICLEHL